MTRRNTRARAEISLTPMIDVMTVLLAVFMITAPMMTAGIDLDLPRAGNSSLAGRDHAVQVSVDKTGRTFLGDVQMSPDAIVRRAAAMRAENPDLSIMINGDASADYGAVMTVMGKLKDAGFAKVGLRTQIDK